MKIKIIKYLIINKFYLTKCGEKNLHLSINRKIKREKICSHEFHEYTRIPSCIRGNIQNHSCIRGN
jgi:hypothetical protein